MQVSQNLDFCVRAFNIFAIPESWQPDIAAVEEAPSPISAGSDNGDSSSSSVSSESDASTELDTGEDVAVEVK